MLTSFELQSQLPVILGLLRFNRLEQFLDVVLCQEGTAQYSHDFIDASVEFKRSFNDCNSTVRDDSHINLYPYSILRISPEGLDAQVSLHPFEKRLYDPSIFIKEGNVLGLQKEIVRVISEGSFEFRFIIHDSPDFGWVVFCISLCGEPHGVVSQDIIGVLQKIFSINHFKLWSSFFPYDEERIEQLNTVQPVQIPVATIKNIAGKRLVVNPVHGIHVMNGSFCDIERYRYLGHYIKLCMYLDAGLGASKPCPLKKRHTQVYGGGIKGIVLPVEFKFLINTLLLSKFYHVVCKLFKNMVITELVCLGKHTSVDWGLSKTKMIGFFGMCRSNIRQFTKTVAAIQLTKHKNEQLVPVGQIPSLSLIVGFCLNKPFKISFGEKICNLTENVSTIVHNRNFLGHQDRQPIQMCDKVFGNIHPDNLIVINDFNRY